MSAGLCQSRIRVARAGFALPEAVAALALLSLAGATLLLTFETTLQAGSDAADQVLAEGIASELLEEICRLPYKEKGGSWNQLVLGPESGEASRSLFDDLDDYHNLTVAPPSDRWGQPIGVGDGQGGQRAAELRQTPGRLAAWRTRVTVQYVDETDHTLVSGTPTRCRRIDVYVERLVGGLWNQLSQATKVVGYAPGAAS